MSRKCFFCLLAAVMLAAWSKSDEPKPATPAATPSPVIPPPQLTITNLLATPQPVPQSPKASGKTIEKGFAVKKAGNLFLTFPKEWKDSIGALQERDKRFDAIMFVPRAGDEFAARVGVINVGDPNAEQLDIKKILHDAGQPELVNSVEKSLDIRDLKGSQTTAYYFVVTDKNRTVAAPKAGEYLYLTQGYARIGRLILSFRLVSNHLSPEQEQLLEMIKTARFEKK